MLSWDLPIEKISKKATGWMVLTFAHRNSSALNKQSSMVFISLIR